MHIRINGWQRIGVILSLLWIIFICGYGGYEYVQGPNGTHYFVEIIKVDTPPTPANSYEKSLSGERKILSFEEFAGPPPVRTFMFGRLIITIIAPLTFAWAIAYLCVIAVQWIAAGFKKNGT